MKVKVHAKLFLSTAFWMTLRGRVQQACFVFVLCAATATALPAQTLSALGSFGGTTNGSSPEGALVRDSGGDFLGATATGGPNTCPGVPGGLPGCGTIFRWSPGNPLATIYVFCSQISQSQCADGFYPNGGLVESINGNHPTILYGTTSSGGANGYGTVFKITAGGQLTTLYSFCSQSGCADGQNPNGGLALAIDGNFYGTALSGGATSTGTVFRITPTGSLTTLYSFCSQSGCADGLNPNGWLVQATDGNFYGTTPLGGDSNCMLEYTNSGCGTIFKITPGGTLTTLHSFNNSDGAGPNGALVQASDGSFYGTTLYGGANSSSICGPNYGCGTFFQISPDGTLTTLYSFCSQSGCADGYNPGPVIQGSDGNLYGTTPRGGTGKCLGSGTNIGCGTIFKITPGGALTTLINFGNFEQVFPDTTDPSSLLLQAPDGNFYGTTQSGGSGSYGMLFSLSAGLGPFVQTQPNFGAVGTPVNILGTNMVGTTSVTFNGTAATFTMPWDLLILTTVPAGATTGNVDVVTPSGTLTSNAPFTVSAASSSGPVAEVLPSSLTFGSQSLGTTSAPQPVTLRNTGNATLTITSIATSPNFAESDNCAGSVAAGSSCTINVTFTPPANGAVTGTLTIADNGVMQRVILSGTGPDFSFGAAVGSSASATTAPGSPASYTLSVGGEGGLSGTVTFTCAGAPSEATCTVSPNPATLGSSATKVTVTVTTTAPSVSAPRSRPLPTIPPHSPGLRGLLILAMVLAATTWAIARRNQTGASRWMSTLPPLVFGFLLILALAGCGGGGGSGGGGSPSNPGTPAGTYTLTVIGTTSSGSSALSHGVTLTLTVS